ncbi:MAG: Daunorubicin/doxorubicin resistance transporter ATP-binding protein DrrA [Thermoleophilia bacterium]|nr:Daunorubicin/doxorubicin resistance transporter ATP-binding protein DrrA [Thermoleophilia bacterium]
MAATTDSNVHGGVRAQGLGKRFGDFWALRGLDIDVAPGTVLGLLGHNGAGKTTALRMLTTLSRPTEGSATVAGFDVQRSGHDVRRNIGVAGQEATVDGLLTVHANLVMIGRLSRLSKAEARARAEELIVELDMGEFSTRLAKDCSGGMRRRLDLAASLVQRPAVLFLDEPTTGLDPLARNNLWATLKRLVAGGMTLVLTTQYLEEADRLADEIVLLDHGRVVAHGSPAELKARIGGQRFVVSFDTSEDADAARIPLAGIATTEVVIDPDDATRVIVPVAPHTSVVAVIATLDGTGLEPLDLQRRDSTLDDVFLTLTETPTAEVASS